MINKSHLLQSEAILTDPSNYWISVINVGRKFPLCRILSIDETNSHVSHVISSLMHVADVMGTSAAHIICQPSQHRLHILALDYYGIADVPSPLDSEDGLPLPNIQVVPLIDTLLRTPTEGLDDPDLLLLPLLDTQADVSRKLKKAYCAPTIVDPCPPLILAAEVAFPFVGEVVIKRKPENGGDKVYKRIEELTEDFRDGKVHPGDLKPAISKTVEDLLVKIREGQKKEVAKKALADIKGYLKKLAAEKKKK